jgi:hypothetical protein
MPGRDHVDSPRLAVDLVRLDAGADEEDKVQEPTWRMSAGRTTCEGLDGAYKEMARKAKTA